MNQALSHMSHFMAFAILISHKIKRGAAENFQPIAVTTESIRFLLYAQTASVLIY